MTRILLLKFRAILPAIICGAALFLLAPRLGAQGLLITGYADFEMKFDKLGSDDTEIFFDNHHFNVVGLGQIYGDLFAGIEVEYEHAGHELAVEYAYIGYTGLKNLRVMAGKFIVPFGRFNKDLHPTWINKMIDRPNGFANVFPQTYSDVGIWLTGAIPVGDGGARVTYDAFAVNGLMGEDGGNIRGFRDNDRDKQEGGRDDNKALGGRLGLELPPQGFDIGASIYSGNYSDDPEKEQNLMMFGADIGFRKSGFEVRGEYVAATQESSGGDLKKSGGYAQASYLINSKFEPVVRYSFRDMLEDDESGDRSRLSFGVSYYLSGVGAIRVNYHLNMEKNEDFETDNDLFAIQFTTSL